MNAALHLIFDFWQKHNGGEETQRWRK